MKKMYFLKAYVMPNISQLGSQNEWYFVTKIVLTYCEKKIVSISDREKVLKFEAEGRQFANF